MEHWPIAAAFCAGFIVGGLTFFGADLHYRFMNRFLILPPPPPPKPEE